jgi:hypothetical protein
MEFVGAGAQMGGTIMQMRQQRLAAEEQRAMFDQRAAVMQEEARETRKAAGYEARESRKEAKRFKGRQKASYAHSGVRSNVGTPLLVQARTVAEFEREASIIQEEGAIRARRLTSGAKWQRKMGRSRTRAAKWQMGTTALTSTYQLGGYGNKRGW